MRMKLASWSYRNGNILTIWLKMAKSMGTKISEASFEGRVHKNFIILSSIPICPQALLIKSRMPIYGTGISFGMQYGPPEVKLWTTRSCVMDHWNPNGRRCGRITMVIIETSDPKACLLIKC